MSKLGVTGVVLLFAVISAGFALPAFTRAPKTFAGRGDAAGLYDAAAACHGTFDRFVTRARYSGPGYDVRYVRRIVADPSGRPVSLPGAERIRVALNLAGGHDNRGTNLLASTLTPLCPNLLQVMKTGDYAGTVSFGLGLRRMTGFRVFRLGSPTRIVVDVAH